MNYKTSSQTSSDQFSNCFVINEGEIASLEEWSQAYGLPYALVCDRFAKGMIPPELFAQPKPRPKKLRSK